MQSEPRGAEPLTERERLVCPACGYTVERDEHPAAAYCGPHPDRTWDPGAKRMVVRSLEIGNLSL